MSIADKLTYLQTTKQLLKTEINKINNVLTDESTFRSYPQELFNGYLDILNNGTDTLWNNLEKVSASGETPVLEDVETAPIKMVLNGNTSQDGTPTPDYPQQVKVVKGENVVSVSGKNLLNDIEVRGGNGIVATLNNDGSISYNGIATATNSYLTNWITSNIPIGNYTFSINSPLIDYNARIQFTYEDSTTGSFNIPKPDTSLIIDLTKKVVQYRLVLQNIIVDTEYNGTLYFQLEQGTEATDYVPYSKTDYPIDLVGENLFDKDDARILRGYIYISNKSINTSNNDYSVIVKIKPNTKYIVTKMANNPEKQARFRLGTATNYPQMGGARDNVCNQVISNDTATELSITTESNDNYLVIFCYNLNTTTTLNEMLGSLVVREAEPIYKEMCKIGDYKDYLFKRNGKWYVHKEIGKYEVLSENIVDVQDVFTNVKYFDFPKPTDDIARGNYNAVDIYYTCAKFASLYPFDTPQAINKILSAAAKNFYRAGFEKGTTLAQAQEKLNGSVLYYVLATPTEEEITNTTLIEQLEAISKAKSVKDKTYITQTNEELPFILDVEAIKEYEVN